MIETLYTNYERTPDPGNNCLFQLYYLDILP